MVSKLHRLSKLQMVHGFALAETPGPLIIVVAFVGFMARYNHFHRSLRMDTLGLLATTFYTFLPCFLFVFAGAPLFERTEGTPAIQERFRIDRHSGCWRNPRSDTLSGQGLVFPSRIMSARSRDVIAAACVIRFLVLCKRGKMNVAYLILLSVISGVVRHQLATLGLTLPAYCFGYLSPEGRPSQYLLRPGCRYFGRNRPKLSGR
jgi:chromate transporter